MSGSTYAYPKSCVRQYQQVHVPTDATYANCRTLLTMLLLSTAVNIQQIESALLKGYIALFMSPVLWFFYPLPSALFISNITPLHYTGIPLLPMHLQPIFYSFQLTLTLTPVSVFIYIPLKVYFSFLSASPCHNVGHLEIYIPYHQFFSSLFGLTVLFLGCHTIYSFQCCNSILLYFKFYNFIFTECLHCLYQDVNVLLFISRLF